MILVPVDPMPEPLPCIPVDMEYSYEELSDEDKLLLPELSPCAELTALLSCNETDPESRNNTCNGRGACG